MAHKLAAWIGGTLGVCVVLGAVYLPPHGMPRWAQTRRMGSDAENEQRLRARDLAAKWREANAVLLGARYRERFGAVLADRRNHDVAGPFLSLEIDDSLRGLAEPLLRGALDSAWARMGLGVSKISVGVMVERPRRSSGTLSSDGGEDMWLSVSYLLPDSSDRSTCLVVTTVPYFAIARTYSPLSRKLNWSASTLGLCAYYARFGVPSRRVEQWLAGRNFDVALGPYWFQEPVRDEVIYWMLGNADEHGWWWGGMYAYPRSTMACFAGRPEACRQGLAVTDLNTAGPRPRVVAPPDPWDTDKVRLVGARWYLSEILRKVGPERFQQFWTTSLPVDSALTLALHQPVGEYTVSWLRSFSPAPRFGAATTPLDALLGLLFAAVLIGLAMFGQGRREIR